MRNLTYTVTMRNVPDDLEAGDVGEFLGDAIDTMLAQTMPDVEASPVRLILPGEQVEFE